MDENEHKKEEINDIDKTIFDYAKDSYNDCLLYTSDAADE